MTCERSRRHGWVLGTLYAASTLVSCGGTQRLSATPPVKAGGTGVAKITPSRLTPEIDTDAIRPWISDGGEHKLLVSGIRIVKHEDGTTERSDQRFPQGFVRAMPLPSRLGGGYLFYQADNQGTTIWKAGGWIDKLSALTHVSDRVDDIIPGFDRLYLRVRTSSALLAIDHDSGKLKPLGNLPVAAGFGDMQFADGWRAVIDTDIRGPMTTFDAGASWHSMGISQPVVSIGIIDGDPSITVEGGGYYRLDMTGHLQFVTGLGESADREIIEQSELPSSSSNSHPLGKRPLRLAIERGYPDSKSTVVVAHKGELLRLGLPRVDVLRRLPKAYPEEDAVCQGARIGKGFGFVCGQQEGSTVIYEFVPPLGLRERARFSEPRFVSPSGNGFVVIRGGCAENTSDDEPTRSYCILKPNGETFEIGVRGGLGAERVVALSDGRVVVLVPPRLGAAGLMTIISGSSVKNVDLKFPEDPKHTVRLAKRGLWLEGFEQRGKDTLGGWIEAGGPSMGVTVKLTGEVKLGKLYDEEGQLLVSGRLALGVNETESALETTDGGMTWAEVVLPQLPESPGDADSRGCTPVGCVLRSWLRLGWGSPATKGDLTTVDVPEMVYAEPASYRPMHLQCQLVSAPQPTAERPDDNDYRHYRYRSYRNAWQSFEGVPAPELGKDEEGVAAQGGGQDQVPSYVYVWGPKGADWTRVGWWSIRFSDRFSVQPVRQSAMTRPPWGDEITAGDAIGVSNRGSYVAWNGILDPSGHSALFRACSGPLCRLYAVSEGRAIVTLRNSAEASPELPQMLSQGAVKLDETWFFLTNGSNSVNLWQASLGTVRKLRSFYQLNRRFQPVMPMRLVRRALGNELGLLIEVKADPASGEHISEWHVLPVDRQSGDLGEPVHLTRADLDGQVPELCPSDQDGWLVDIAPGLSPSITQRGFYGYFESMEYRLRMEPGYQCVEAIAARIGSDLRATDKPGALNPGLVIPMAARERYSGRLWHLACGSE